VTAWLVALGPLLTGPFGPPGLVPFYTASPVSAIDPSMLSDLSGLRAGESVIRAGADGASTFTWTRYATVTASASARSRSRRRSQLQHNTVTAQKIYFAFESSAFSISIGAESEALGVRRVVATPRSRWPSTPCARAGPRPPTLSTREE
jgi:hypothetical protein